MADEPDIAAADALERKLATILSADVAEYSRLMAEDEEATLRLFRAHRQVFDQLVALHRGRIFNTAGDAVLAEFGSAVEAVRCATEIQAALRTRNDQLPPQRQVRFRIGVNLGDVMVHGTDLLGDGVNVAARLQAAAEPGGVCISGSVYDQIRNKLSLSFRSLGEQSFKNIPQPVRTFAISESEDHGALPAPKVARPRRIGRRPAWIIAGVVLIIAASNGIWPFQHDRPLRHERRGKTEQVTAAATDGTYGGPICYAATGEDPARCFRAQATVGDGKIAGRWLAREPGVTMIMNGVVAESGAAQIEMHTENADGMRLHTITLSGSLRDGKLDATGGFLNGRKVDLTWQRQ